MKRMQAVAAVMMICGAAFAAAPATRSGGAATAPAMSPQEVAFALVEAVARGDEKGAFAQLYFANEQAKAEATALIGEEIERSRFEEAMEKILVQKRGGMTDQDLAKM